MPRSLEAVSGLESNSRVFTVQVQGLLQLQVRIQAQGTGGWALSLGGSYSLVQVGGQDL